MGARTSHQWANWKCTAAEYPAVTEHDSHDSRSIADLRLEPLLHGGMIAHAPNAGDQKRTSVLKCDSGTRVNEAEFRHPLSYEKIGHYVCPARLA